MESRTVPPGSLIHIPSGRRFTVSRIASRAGLTDASEYVDLSLVKDDDALREAVRTKTVFGRVTPDQKKRIVQLLKE